MRAKLNGLRSTPVFIRQGDKAPPLDPASLPIEISDARMLQAGAESGAALFAEHGFALVAGQPPLARIGDAVPDGYDAQIGVVVRETLFPGRKVEMGPSLAPLFRGGCDTDVVYADWVHQDFGLTAQAFAGNLAGIVGEDAGRRWLARYDQPDVEGCVAISCWRTIGMREPLRHMPIALCDPRTVAMADVVADAGRSGMDSYHIALRHAASQRWYSYPAMTSDEVLTFKLFECSKDDPGPSRLRSVFHTAFDDPDMPADAERRHSCEYRVIVMLLRD